MTLALGLVLLASVEARAEKIKLGTATGGLMVYYNNLDTRGANGGPDGVVSGYDEHPTNQAYTQAQASYGNTNGMSFQFDSADVSPAPGIQSFNDIFSGQPVGSSQFGLDLLMKAATYNAAGGVLVPDVDFKDNTNNTVAGALITSVNGDTSWAINDYKEPSSGPGDAQNRTINSLFRGTSATLQVLNFAVINGLYSIDVKGELRTDGIFHWYNPAQPHSTLSSWGLSDTLLFEGTLRYNPFYRQYQTPDPRSNTDLQYASGFENGKDQRDFYEGALNVYVQPVPEPGTMTLLGLGLAGIARKLRKRA